MSEKNEGETQCVCYHGSNTVPRQLGSEQHFSACLPTNVGKKDQFIGSVKVKLQKSKTIVIAGSECYCAAVTAFIICASCLISADAEQIENCTLTNITLTLSIAKLVL